MSYQTGLKVILLVVFTLLLCRTAVRADEFRGLAPGDYVRCRVIDPAKPTDTKKLEGKLTALNDTSMSVLISSWNSPLALSRQQVINLDVRTSPSRKGQGTLIGLGVGMLVGGVIGYAVGEEPSRTMTITPTPEQAAFAGAFVLGVIGAIVGAIESPGARWEPVIVGSAPVNAAGRPSRVGTVAVKLGF